jgi:hypothetical protein
LKLDRSIDNLVKKLDRLDPIQISINKTNLSYWKSKLIIPLDQWTKFRDTPHVLDCFPDDFDRLLTCFSEDEFGEQKREDVRKWNLDFHELMEHTSKLWQVEMLSLFIKSRWR